MRFLYTCSISLFGIGIRVYSLFNQKAALWIAGRKNWEKELRKNLKGHDGLIWLHCSSLGEFEQGRPIIEALEKKGQKILLTFFSPSGYEHLKNYKYAAYVCYLPLDNQRNAKKFLEIARPKAAIFVK